MNLLHFIIAVIAVLIALRLYFHFSGRFDQCESKAWSRPARETLAMRLRILCELKALHCYIEERVLGLDAEIAHMERAVVEFNYPEDLKEYALRRIANRDSEKEEFLATLSDLSAQIKYMDELVNASREAVEEEAQAARQSEDRERAVRVCMA